MFVKRYQLPGLTTRRWLRTRPAPGPIPNHPPLHTSNLAFNLMNVEFLFYLARSYVKRRLTFHSSISNLSLKLNSKARVWDWTVELCLPTTIALTIIQYIQSYNHTIILSYNHTIHRIHTFIQYVTKTKRTQLKIKAHDVSRRPSVARWGLNTLLIN